MLTTNMITINYHYYVCQINKVYKLWGIGQADISSYLLLSRLNEYACILIWKVLFYIGWLIRRCLICPKFVLCIPSLGLVCWIFSKIFGFGTSVHCAASSIWYNRKIWKLGSELVFPLYVVLYQLNLYINSFWKTNFRKLKEII